MRMNVGLLVFGVSCAIESCHSESGLCSLPSILRESSLLCNAHGYSYGSTVCIIICLAWECTELNNQSRQHNSILALSSNISERMYMTV